MAIIRNTAGQGLYIYAHDIANDEPETGDAANITATISLDGAAPGPLTDVNPTEIAGGVYWFGLTQAEANAGALALVATSTTADVQIDPVLVLTQEVGIDTLAVPGDAMTLEAAERTTLAGVVWNTLTSALTTAGSIGKYIVDYLAAIAAKTNLLGTTAITYSGGGVSTSGDVEIVRGDAYLDSIDRRLEWTVATWDIAVTSAVVVIIQGVAALTGERLSATSVGLELTSAQTLVLPEGCFTFYIQEILVDGVTKITRATGDWETTDMPEEL